MLKDFLPKGKPTKISLKSGLDSILKNGIESKTVTQFYGPPASGKTNLCLIAATQCAKEGKKAIFIDTEGGHSIERLRQIAGKDSTEVLEKILFYEPLNFTDQAFVMENIESVLDDDTGLIILDSAVAFYRCERNDENASELNKALSQQIAKLAAIAREKNIATLITTQVYSSYENDNEVEPVGGSILKYWSKVIIELKKTGKDIDAILVRHRELPEGIKTRFRITQSGIETVE